MYMQEKRKELKVKKVNPSHVCNHKNNPESIVFIGHVLTKSVDYTCIKSYQSQGHAHLIKYIPTHIPTCICICIQKQRKVTHIYMVLFRYANRLLTACLFQIQLQWKWDIYCILKDASYRQLQFAMLFPILHLK